MARKYNWIATYVLLISQTLFLAGASWLYFLSDKMIEFSFLIVGYVLLIIGYLALMIPVLKNKR